MKQTKPYKIPKSLLYEAYQRVKANKGGSGVDGQSLQAFDQDLSACFKSQSQSRPSIKFIIAI